MEEEKVFWIVKYALTAGIQKVTGRIVTDSMIAVTVRGSFETYYHRKNKQWCDNIEDARRIAEDMRQKKITSLKKQVANLEKLDFGEGSNE